MYTLSTDQKDQKLDQKYTNFIVTQTSIDLPCTKPYLNSIDMGTTNLQWTLKELELDNLFAKVVWGGYGLWVYIKQNWP